MRAGLLLYEGFDITPGHLDGQAGNTSFGFDPVFGTAWDKGIFDDPEVGSGSIAAPPSTSAFYSAAAVGNRVVQDFQSTTITRVDAVSAPHLYGTFLTHLALDGFFTTRASVLFTNFSVYAENPGSNSTAASWYVQTSGGVTNTRISAQGTTLVSWELNFDQTNSLLPDTLRVWFNTNPLTAAPDVQSTMADLGLNELGGITLRNDIFLGLSTVEYDEFRIGSDWASAGISATSNAVPEPSGWLLGMLGAATWGAVHWQRRRRHALTGCW